MRSATPPPPPPPHSERSKNRTGPSRKRTVAVVDNSRSFVIVVVIVVVAVDLERYGAQAFECDGVELAEQRRTDDARPSRARRRAAATNDAARQTVRAAEWVSLAAAAAAAASASRNERSSCASRSDSVAANVLGAVTRIVIVVALSAFVFSTVPTWYAKQKLAFDIVEWIVSILFTVEYLLRFYSCVEEPFFGRRGAGCAEADSAAPRDWRSLVARKFTAHRATRQRSDV